MGISIRDTRWPKLRTINLKIYFQWNERLLGDLTKNSFFNNQLKII